MRLLRYHSFYRCYVSVCHTIRETSVVLVVPQRLPVLQHPRKNFVQEQRTMLLYYAAQYNVGPGSNLLQNFYVAILRCKMQLE